jgi:putative addiction module component (TIGR02574 family)
MATDVSGLSSDAQQVFEAALRLPDAQRAKLADCLWESVGPTDDLEWEKAWSAEIARRIAEVDNGSVALQTWPEVRQRMQEALNAARKS